MQDASVGDAGTRTVRAYQSRGHEFATGSSPTALVADGQSWRIEEGALVSTDGARLPRLAGHIAYWFAWQGFIDGAPPCGTRRARRVAAAGRLGQSFSSTIR